MTIVVVAFIAAIIAGALLYPNFRASRLATKRFLEGTDPTL